MASSHWQAHATEVCRLVVQWRGQIGSASQVLKQVRLSESKANSLYSYYHCPLHWTTNLQTSVLVGLVAIQRLTTTFSLRGVSSVVLIN